MSDAREGQRLNLPREGIGRQQPVERRHPPPRLDLQTFDLRRRVRAQHAALDGTWPRVADHAGIVARRGDTPPASDPPFPPRRPSGMAETEPSPGEVRRRPRRISGHHARKEARRRATSGHALPDRDRRPGSPPQPRQHRELVEPSAWPAELTRRWTVPVGQGYATPIIVGDRVFMFTRQIVAGRARRPPPRAFRGAMSGMSENHASGFPPPANDQDHRPQHTQPDVHQLWLRWRLSTPPSMNSAGHRSRHDVARAASRIQLACWRRLMCSRAAIARNPERVVPASLAASSMRSSVRRAIEMFSRTVSRSASSSARSTLTAPII